MGYGQGRAPTAEKAAIRTVLLAGADSDLRGRLREQLTAMRWQVREAGGGAEAMAMLDLEPAEAMVLDSVLPDLEVTEFAEQMRARYPAMDLIEVDGGPSEGGARSPRRNELLHALRLAQNSLGRAEIAETPAWPPTRPVPLAGPAAPQISTSPAIAPGGGLRPSPAWEMAGVQSTISPRQERQERMDDRPRVAPLPEMVGESAVMQELARLVRLVAPRSAPVLIEGETGTGKELVALALHRLSQRAAKPLVVLNCAAIPESLLEAELFGHTRGAFTGAVQSRTGRIEAAHGGTLFLDEIGEMPLALQAKMLRFLESGELQRVGDNDAVHVDVRVVAATHQPLRLRAEERVFRLDLYHRLAVFPVAIPALRERLEDVLPLAGHLLARMGEQMPVKHLSAAAAARLLSYDWPGNVRELAHVLERAAILAENSPEIGPAEIRF